MAQSYPQPVTRYPAGMQWAWVFTCLGMATHILLSADALFLLGIPYDAPFGPPIAKVHPGSYLMLLGLLTGLASLGNPLRIMATHMHRHTLLSAYFVGMITVLAWALYRHGTSGQTFLVEALLVPAIASYAILLHDAAHQRKAFYGVMALLVFNALVGLIEYATKSRLIPFMPVAGIDNPAEEYFRSSALLGHPLENALVTASLLPALAMLPGSTILRLAGITTMALALLAFGGRTSLGVGLLTYSFFLTGKAFIGVIRGRFSYLQLTGGSVAIVVGLCVFAFVVLGTGIGERIFSNLTWDNSASVRTRVLDAFDYVSTEEMWLGLSVPEIDHVKLRLGLDPRFEAIENYWIYLLLNLGIIGFTPFVLGLACLFVQLLRKASAPMCAGVLVYLLAGSTANTLAAKTVSLTLLTFVIFSASSLLRKPPRQ
jgi:hypothetical protein